MSISGGATAAAIKYNHSTRLFQIQGDLWQI